MVREFGERVSSVSYTHLFAHATGRSLADAENLDGSITLGFTHDDADLAVSYTHLDVYKRQLP